MNQRRFSPNVDIRRADWRFLLPEPQSSSTLFSGDPVLAQAAARFSNFLVGPGKECNLAVLSNPNERMLALAWQSLSPGSACYVEWSRIGIGGVNGLKRRLEKAGFTGIRSYTPWPQAFKANTSFWLPVDQGPAASYFLASRGVDAGLRRRSRQILISIAWQAAGMVRLFHPLCQVAFKPGSVNAAEQDLPGRLLSEWDESNLGKKPARLSWVLVTAGQAPTGKVVGLVYADREKAPRLVVKLPRVAESITALQREAEMLQAVEAHAGILTGYPHFLFLEQLGGIPVLGETALRGLPLYRLLKRNNAGHLAMQATRWLADLAGRGPLAPKSEWWPHLVEPVITQFEQCYRPLLVTGQMQNIRTCLKSLPDLPQVIEQRDFSPWNVLVNQDGNLAILDWESGEPFGLPGMDLVYFLTHLAFFLDHAMPPGDYINSYCRMLDTRTFTGQLADECIQYYSQYTGISPHCFPALRLLAWMLHAVSEYRRMEQDEGSSPRIEALKGSLFFNLWKEDLKHARY